MMVEGALYKIIGKKVKQYRRAKKLSQSSLADQLGLTRTSITNIENGSQRPPIHVIYNICIAMKISLGEIMPSIDAVINHANAHEKEDTITNALIQKLQNDAKEPLPTKTKLAINKLSSHK